MENKAGNSSVQVVVGTVPAIFSRSHFIQSVILIVTGPVAIVATQYYRYYLQGDGAVGS